MEKIGPILIIIGTVFLLLYFFFLVFLNSKIKDKDEQNSFLNSFPYQFYCSNSIQVRIFLYLLLIVFSLCTSIGEAMYFVSLKSVHFITLSVIFPLSLILIVTSNFTPLSKYKSHILCAFLGFGMYIFSSLFYAFSNIIPGAVLFQNSISIFSTIILGIFGSIGLILFFNKKLLDWPKMDKAEIDGKTIYVKPKINYLALYEWIYLILEGLTGIVIFINSML